MGSTHPQAVADGLQAMQASIGEHRAWLEARE
jgi:hypothetical protein